MAIKYTTKNSFWAELGRDARDLYKNYGPYKKMAGILKKHVLKEFSEEKQYKKFADFIIPEENYEIDEWLNNLDVKEIA